MRLPGGRLIAYFPDFDLSDGAAELETKGFFSVHNCPPEDTWIWLSRVVSKGIVNYELEAEFSNDCLVAWIPPEFVELADNGIQVNPEQCIQWLDILDIPLVHSLRRLKLLS